MTEIVQININTSHYSNLTDRYRINLGQTVNFSKCKLSLVNVNVEILLFRINAARL